MNLPFNEILIASISNNLLAFTAAWKALEMELIEANIKADLVQLNGYYQYEPNIACAMDCSKQSQLEFLRSVVNGKLTRKLLSEDIFIKEWNTDSKGVRERAESMRRLGYEIRNTKTNPQIPPGYWLIPYPFPTLNPLSVQLRKSIN